MSLQKDARLGQYVIGAPLGAGGMGEVYRARDTKLNRDVAIKVLPAHLAQDPAALQRFEREAQAVAALSHPNILALFDFGSDGGVAYAVTELLEGETLRQRMQQGQLPPRKAIEFGVQVVRGIAAAHQKGIIHRDLKPENIFITRDGQVKILDFGLAKATDLSAEPEATQIATATQPGTVMGTVGYMSPEQVRGLTVDHRTDIFSFGSVLYEMLSGRKAFKGDSHVETMNAILKEDPPEFAEVAAGIPSSLDRIIRHCLEKQPEERFHSAHDLGIALETVSGASSVSSTSVNVAPLKGRPASGLGRALRSPALAAGVAVVLGAVGYLAGGLGAEPASAPILERLTFRRGPIFSLKLAPDGNTIVYSAAFDGARETYSTREGSPESLKLPFDRADVVSISSKGELALVMNFRNLSGYARAGTLARAPISGGASRAIIEDVQDADWLPDGSDLVVSRYVEGQSQLEFPIGTVVYKTGGYVSHPRVSPDGTQVAFLDHPLFGDDRGSVAVVDRSGKVTKLPGEYSSTRGLAWTPSGTEIWFAGKDTDGSGRAIHAVTPAGVVRTIFRAPADLTLGDIRADGAVLIDAATERRGIIGLAPGETKERDLSWLDWSMPVALSDDGTTLLIGEQGDGGGAGYSVYLRKTDGSPAVRLGSGDADSLSSDGKWVLSQRVDPPPAQLQVLPTGAGAARLVTNDEIIHTQGQFMPDGRSFLFTGSAPGRQARTYVQDLEGGAPKPVTPEGVSGLRPSPDGKFLIAQRKFYPIAGGEPQEIPGLEPADAIIRWTPDGKGLFLRRTLDGGVVQVLRLDFASGKRTPIRTIEPISEAAGMGGIGGLLLSGDGKSYVYGYGVTLSGLYLVKGLK